jgi:serine/threonine protein kinase
VPEAPASANCAFCDRPLATDDRFCARCGTPTPRNSATDITLVDPVGAKRGSQEVTAPVTPDSPAPAAEPRQSGQSAKFNERLQDVLGAEYDVIALAGQGGFARVYRCKDKRLNRIVAIKVVKPELLGTKELVDRFRAEGIALAKLRHPHIVPVFDIRERDGLIYYIMPFVQGTTLDARLGDRMRLPPLEAKRIVSELADALGAAHRAKMIHLDIKPANVFLEGDQQKVLLMDFGIAKALTDQVQDNEGEPIVGTPEYMSPEQAKGSADIDHRSDIYSLGALGYRMLVGRPPFRGNNITEILAKHVSEPAWPIRDINPSIPKEFADAIMKCLAKDPWERFSTAQELRASLDTVSFFTRNNEPVRENPRVSPVLAGLLAFVVGLLVGMLLV